MASRLPTAINGPSLNAATSGFIGDQRSLHALNDAVADGGGSVPFAKRLNEHPRELDRSKLVHCCSMCVDTK